MISKRLQSKVIYFMAGLTVANGINYISGNNSQNETVANSAPVPSELDNPIDCKYLYFKSKNCQSSAEDSQDELLLKVSKAISPPGSSNTSQSSPLPKLSVYGLANTLSLNNKPSISPPKKLSNKVARRSRSSANLRSKNANRRRYFPSDNLVAKTNLTSSDINRLIPVSNNQLKNYNPNLDAGLNNNQAEAILLTNSSTSELFDSTRQPELNSHQIQPTLSANNGADSTPQTQAQELPASTNLPSNTNQLNPELISSKIEAPQNIYKAQPEFAKKPINLELIISRSQPQLPFK
ncbi:MAG: hypothetical protein WBB28_16280 [Crinalium sp.]